MTQLTTPSATLDQALADAIERYRVRHPASARQLEQAAEVLPGGNTRSVLFQAPFPLTMVRGEGCWLWDADGHRLLDALGEFTAGLYGHSAAPIREAIVAALDGGLSLSSHTLREVEMAREIVQRFPSMALLRFTNSGTEANLLALAAAVAHTGRRKVLVFEGAYHGGVLAFGGAAASVNVPHEWLLAPYNDLDAARGDRAARRRCAGRDPGRADARCGRLHPRHAGLPARPAPAGRRQRRAADASTR